VTLPNNPVSPFEGRRRYVHEIGHCLLSNRSGAPISQSNKEALRVHQREDKIIEVFASEWFLPADVVRRNDDDEELAEQLGCPVEYVRQRRQALHP
jgi:hypothetical protein